MTACKGPPQSTPSNRLLIMSCLEDLFLSHEEYELCGNLQAESTFMSLIHHLHLAGAEPCSGDLEMDRSLWR